MAVEIVVFAFLFSKDLESQTGGKRPLVSWFVKLRFEGDFFKNSSLLGEGFFPPVSCTN